MRFILLPFLLLLLLPASASAKPTLEERLAKSRHLWSTVHSCDTKKHPNQLGIRASMPGTGVRAQRMFMRFRAQYKADGVWRNFSRNGPDSRWQPVGPAHYKARQSGWFFPFRPKKGQAFELRARVDFRWRRGSRIVAQVKEFSTPGHSARGADPDGYSAATCEIRG